jgi:hypothetical protein
MGKVRHHLQLPHLSAKGILEHRDQAQTANSLAPALWHHLALALAQALQTVALLRAVAPPLALLRTGADRREG